MSHATADDLAAITAAADLGSIAAAVLIKRGSVESWRLTTPRGDFHVKRFTHGRDPALRQSLTACADVERTAQRAGISIAEPIALMLDVGEAIVQVHRWWPGRPIAPGDDITGWLGHTLVTLHTLPPPAAAPDDALTSYYGLHAEPTWRTWFAEGRARGLAWADGDERLAAVVATMAIIGGGLAVEHRRAGTHRDLLGANVLIGSGGCALIDWDSAGPDVPWFEAVRTAVEFGRLAATVNNAKPPRPDPRVARDILRAYEAAGGERGVTGRAAMSGVLGMALWRIAFAVQASLGELLEPADERAEQTAYLPGALAKLSERLRTLDDVVAEIGL